MKVPIWVSKENVAELSTWKKLYPFLFRGLSVAWHWRVEELHSSLNLLLVGRSLVEDFSEFQCMFKSWVFLLFEGINKNNSLSTLNNSFLDYSSCLLALNFLVFVDFGWRYFIDCFFVFWFIMNNRSFITGYESLKESFLSEFKQFRAIVNPFSHAFICQTFW